MLKIKKIIGALKKSSGLSDEALARELKITLQTFYNYKQGKTMPKSQNIIEKIWETVRKYEGKN